MAYGYTYGGYPGPGGYYSPPVPDQLAQLRQGGQYQPQMMGQQPVMQNQQPMQQPVIGQQFQPTNTGSILWVSNEREAQEYPVAPNSAVALWDANNPVVYLKKADASGKPDTEIYDLVKRNAVNATTAHIQAVQTPSVEYVPVDRFDALAARCDAMAAELEALKNKQCKCAPKKLKEDTVDG